MSYYYAQINDNNICDGISRINELDNRPSMIQLDSYDASVIGKLWTGSEWIENPNPPEPQPEPQPETVTLNSLQEKIDQLEQQNMALMMGMVDVYAAVTTGKGE